MSQEDALNAVSAEIIDQATEAPQYDPEELEQYIKLINGAIDKFDRYLAKGNNSSPMSNTEIHALLDVAKRGREEYRKYLRFLNSGKKS